MAYLNPQDAYDELQERVLAGIRDNFPMDTKLKHVELHGLEVRGGGKGPEDLRSQHKARVEGRTWHATVYGDISLKDASTGRVLDRQKVRMANIPMVTARNTFIINGKEKQAQSQWRLMPGVYTRRTGKGELEARFNVPSQRDLNIKFDPKNKLFKMTRGSSKAIPVYPLMKEMGVSDDELERAWGRDIFSANKAVKRPESALLKFYRADKRATAPNIQEARKHFLDMMSSAELEPDAMEKTLGKPHTRITGEVMRDATKKMLAVHKGAPEDDRDSLLFKHLLSTGDFAHERLTAKKTKKGIRGKVQRRVFKGKTVRDVVQFDMFNDPVKSMFTESGELIGQPQQINPVEMLRASMQTTIMGRGGVQSQNVVDAMVGSKLVNPSHMGMLDPVRTPEGGKTGVSLSLPMGVKKVGKTMMMPLFNLRSKKMEYVSAAKFHQKKVILPDQVTWNRHGQPSAKSSKVRASGIGNEPEEMSMKDAEYVMRHPSQLFSVTTNLIPFLGNNSGNRATYAGQQIEQAISLKHRDAPEVQVRTSSDLEGARSFEELVGGRASHRSPVSGVVLGVDRDKVTIRGDDKRNHTVDLYNNFPLNDPKSMMDSTPLAGLKRGVRVKARQVIADTNFTKRGTLALGTNLRVAYLPYKGYNFEDGVVISESAATKLSSEHLHKPDVDLLGELGRKPDKFRLMFSDTFSKDQYGKLGEDGVVKKGQLIRTGDPLVLASRPYQARDSASLHRIGKALSGRHTDTTLRWKSDYEGEVVGVHKTKKGLSIHIKTLEKMQVGDKITGRHGNKGIVTKILPDKDMPRVTTGKESERHIEVALNPLGVPGRMNVGQVLETVAAKIAHKTGKTYMIENFDGTDQITHLKKELKKHGLSDQDELIDPLSGRSLGKALVGRQHMLKMHHQVDKKNSVRSGMALPGGEEEPESYDVNLMPGQGGKSGGMRVDALSMYALLAHGAKANIREMQTWKSEGPDNKSDESKEWKSQHTEVWDAIQSGGLYPLPKTTFAYDKFKGMLMGAGINMTKRGNHLQLSPVTNKQVLAMSSGELKRPYFVVDAKTDKDGELKAKAGGIFDKAITGGPGGRKWSHIKMAESLPNPVFETPIQKLTGLKQKEFDSLVGGETAVSSKGKIVPLDTPGSTTGGPAIGKLLGRIDVKKDLKKAESDLSTIKLGAGIAHKGGAALTRADGLVKKIKYLRALDQEGLKAKDAYMLDNLPVMPPSMRPPTMLDDGGVKWQDINELYSLFGQVNTTLKDPRTVRQPNEFKAGLRAELYDGTRALMGYKIAYDKAPLKGIIHQIKGSDPKKGYFQSVMTSRRQDMSMRSTIVPEPDMGLDEIGLPKKKAVTLFKPFVVRKLVEMGAASGVPEARALIVDYGKGKNTDTVMRALDLVTQERPVLMKRDPVLHKHSIQGFKARLVEGKAIKIHPLVTGGFNADFDGDQMSVYVPITKEAVKEAYDMMPSQNLYGEASGRVMYQPTLESALGLYKLSQIGKSTKLKFKSSTQMIEAVNAGKLGVNDVATVDGQKRTMGRMLVAQALPDGAMKTKILTDHKFIIDKDGIGEMFNTLAKEKGEFGGIANKLKDLGYGAAFGQVPVFSGATGTKAIIMAEKGEQRFVSMPTHSFSLDDFTPDKALRDPILAKAQRVDDTIRANKKLSRVERDSQIVDTWERASNELDTAHHKKNKGKNVNNLLTMQRAGVKPSWAQYKQIVLSSVQVEDASGKPILQPVKRGYSEGLDVSEYWTQQQGARRGAVMKTQEVKGPGVFSKRLMQATMNMVITEEDCGTTQGVSMSVSKDKDHIHDRMLSKDYSHKGVTFSAGQILNPDVVGRIRSVDKNAELQVHSPLKCELGEGMCQKCAGSKAGGGTYNLGTNVGILAAQAAGERSTQLTMKAFHTGGIRTSGGARAVSDFDKVEQLMTLPEEIPNSAQLSAKTGVIEKIKRTSTGSEITVGGVSHFVGLDDSGLALHQRNPLRKMLSVDKPWDEPVVGMKVRAGQSLTDPTRTVINPRDLYRATNDIATVKGHLVSELSDIYGKDVRRQHIETMVRAMGNLTKIRDEGDSEGLLRGDFAPATKINAMNKELVKAGKRPIEHSPVLVGRETLPLNISEDWAAKMQHIKAHSTLADSAAMGASSDIHGLHPIPGILFGAEFGRTAKDSLMPGLEHLKNVQDTRY